MSIVAIQWFLSLMSIYMLMLTGSQSVWGAILGLVIQFVWVYYAFLTKQYGLLPGMAGYFAVHIFNFVRFKRGSK